MSWYKISQIQPQLIGYKIVALKGNKAVSLAGQSTVYDLTIGSVCSQTYLGTNEKFCIDYYSGLTDLPEMILTYSYDPKDIISGGGNNSEVKVKKAVLKGSRRL